MLCESGCTGWKCVTVGPEGGGLRVSMYGMRGGGG